MQGEGAEGVVQCRPEPRQRQLHRHPCREGVEIVVRGGEMGDRGGGRVVTVGGRERVLRGWRERGVRRCVKRVVRGWDDNM